MAGRKRKILPFVLDCQTRNSEGVFEKKNNFRRGGGFYGNGISKAWGVEHFGISEGRGGGGWGKISMPPVVWYGYFLESPNFGLKSY